MLNKWNDTTLLARLPLDLVPWNEEVGLGPSNSNDISDFKSTYLMFYKWQTFYYPKHHSLPPTKVTVCVEDVAAITVNRSTMDHVSRVDTCLTCPFLKKQSTHLLTHGDTELKGISVKTAFK